MDVITLSLLLSSVRVRPDRSQFFEYESFSLSCEEDQRRTSGWTVRRNTSTGGASECGLVDTWGVLVNSLCTIGDAYALDSGAYWCQSADGERSNTVNITVTERAVILDSPALPVMEGSDVTLHCRYDNKTTGKTSPDLPADFYKDGSLVKTESTGQMTIHSVYKSDRGFYKCNISDLGESPESWMDVREAPEKPGFLHRYVLPSVLGTGLFLVLLLLLVVLVYVRKRHRGNSEYQPSFVTYADITITQGRQANRERGVSTLQETVYSSVKHGAT